MPTKTIPLPPVEELRRLFNYDPETGILTNAIDRATNAKKGQEAGKANPSSKGYKILGVNKRLYKAHRIIWKMHYGYEPSHEIDHINGDRSDNRIANLRDVPKEINQINRQVKNANNKTGIRGVYWKGNGFMASKPTHHGKKGSNYLKFGSLLDCAAARISLENKLGIAA
jgi:hypothetical protein